jgi:hypothetical protein
MTVSPVENPFKAIEAQFQKAYDPDSGMRIDACGPNEFIGGTQADGGHLGLYRPFIDADLPATFRVQDASPTPLEDLPEADIAEEQVREYLIGGDEEQPIGFEVTGTEPFGFRLLNPKEMAGIAQKVVSTTFF